MNRKILVAIALIAGLESAPVVRADFSFSLPLTTGSGNKLDLGLFAGGSSLQITTSGHGDLVDSRWQVNPDGSLFATAQGAYSFANQGAAYTTVNGGDGVNHFAGGGANYDETGSGYGFAGKLTTDTTDPGAIRLGTVVGTFSAAPTRSDWFPIGLGATIVVPAGGAYLFVAVNDSYNPDNHGTYSVLVTINTVPEPSGFAMLTVGLIGSLAFVRRHAAHRRKEDLAGSPSTPQEIERRGRVD